MPKRWPSAVPEEASRARSKPFFQRFARLGIFARSLIYALLAYIAAVIGLTHSAPAQENSSGALSEVGRQPAGRLLLGLLAVGLVAYAVWRIAQALSGDQGLPNGRSAAAQNGRSSAAKDAIKRVGWAFVGVVYFSLCGQAIALAVSSNSGGSSGNGPSSHPQPLVGTVLRWPAGAVWVGLGGAAIAISGAALAIWGITHDYSDVLETDRMSRGKFLAAQVSGAVGEATRGLLIILVAVYLFAAAVDNNPSRAKSLSQALLSFARLPAGPALLFLAAVGLASFAIYSVFEALYRRV